MTLKTDLVERLCDLHRKMLSAVQQQRPYPVKIALGDSDVDTVLDAAIALDIASRTLPLDGDVVDLVKDALLAAHLDNCSAIGYWERQARAALSSIKG